MNEQGIGGRIGFNEGIEEVLCRGKHKAEILNSFVKFILPVENEAVSPYSQLDEILAREMIELGIQRHNHTKRKNGTYYFIHPLFVAKYASLLGGKDKMITPIVSLFHDDIEHIVEKEDICTKEQVMQKVGGLKGEMDKIIQGFGQIGPSNYPSLTNQASLILPRITRLNQLTYYKYFHEQVLPIETWITEESRATIIEESKAAGRTMLIKIADRGHNILNMEAFDMPHKLYSIIKNFFVEQEIRDRLNRYEKEYSLRENIKKGCEWLAQKTLYAAKEARKEAEENIPEDIKKQYEQELDEYLLTWRATEVTEAGEKRFDGTILRYNQIICAYGFDKNLPVVQQIINDPLLQYQDAILLEAVAEKYVKGSTFRIAGFGPQLEKRNGGAGSRNGVQ